MWSFSYQALWICSNHPYQSISSICGIFDPSPLVSSVDHCMNSDKLSERHFPQGDDVIPCPGGVHQNHLAAAGCQLQSDSAITPHHYPSLSQASAKLLGLLQHSGGKKKTKRRAWWILHTKTGTWLELGSKLETKKSRERPWMNTMNLHLELASDKRRPARMSHELFEYARISLNMFECETSHPASP